MAKKNLYTLPEGVRPSDRFANSDLTNESALDRLNESTKVVRSETRKVENAERKLAHALLAVKRSRVAEVIIPLEERNERGQTAFSEWYKREGVDPSRVEPLIAWAVAEERAGEPLPAGVARRLKPVDPDKVDAVLDKAKEIAQARKRGGKRITQADVMNARKAVAPPASRPKKNGPTKKDGNADPNEVLIGAANTIKLELDKLDPETLTKNQKNLLIKVAALITDKLTK